MMKHNSISVFLLLFFCSTVFADAPDRVLIVVGPSRHPPGSHEAAAGGRVLKHCVENMQNLPGVHADLVYEWPSKKLQDSAATIVFIGDTFPPNRFPNPQRNIDELSVMMERGCGIVCVHYATGLLGEDVTKIGEHPLLEWMGGYFANRSCPHHESIARIYKDAIISPAAVTHPITRGWNEFTLHDEPYINNYFGGNDNQLSANVTALATSMLPPENPKKETVAWCVERKDTGRGFGIVMPHFYKNWRDEDLRRFILNGIVWTAKQDVPERGIKTVLPELIQFDPESVEFVPRKK